MSNSAISPFAFPAARFGFVSKLIMALAAFMEHQDLLLGSSNLATGSHITTDYAKTIWVYEQAFISLSKAEK